MKQVCQEIWMENKRIPILAVLKLGLLFLSVVSGVLIKGYPYSILTVVMLVSLESTFFKGAATHIEYLVPYSVHDRKDNIIKRSMFIAGVYSACNTLGYIVTIHFSGRYYWDGEMVIFVVLMFLFVWSVIVAFRIFLEKVKYLNVENVSQKMQKKALLFYIAGVIVAVLGMVEIYVFLVYKFAKIELFQFLQNTFYKEIWVASAITIVVGFTVMTYYLGKKFEISDFAG